ncbi:MAG: pentapeptide repeat-containing protein [Brevundimonas sp.]|uniref:pentapeptide repeat-containing protein n=1 Tax=Brevundimonas sp. TaxID=1871086 RepID=UPI0027342E0C|nr:pentapeptide repeat-containing protein [Brevundimonas sp.]MDP3657793.1 pentapeptide repeat-containing protein [Brevundimonas sp.]MDZ4112970.1 pentapeptide repeat-containing protein [Brevundimonas sp.]
MNQKQPEKANDLSDLLQRLVDLALDDDTISFRQLAIAAGLDPSQDFIGADLRALDLRDEDLEGFDFGQADLKGADLRRAKVEGVNFDGANLMGVIGLPSMRSNPSLAPSDDTPTLQPAPVSPSLEDLEEEIAELRRQLGPPDDSAMMETRFRLANALLTLGRRMGRKELVVEALGLFRQGSGDISPTLDPTLYQENENSLGRALRVLGEIAGDPLLLQESIDTLRRLCDGGLLDPVQHAKTLEHLGSSLRSLGERTSSIPTLAAAASAFEDALTSALREAEPARWAQVQTNLGNTLARLASRGPSSERQRLYAAAIAAFETALTIQTRQTQPSEWARSKNNLANVLIASTRRTGGIGTAREALNHYRDALEMRDRARTPLQWARTQCGIGIALSRIGSRRRGTAELEAALASFEEALREQSPERAQRDWAHTRLATGYTMLLLGSRLSDPDKLKAAERAFSDAIAVLPAMDQATAHKALSRAARAISRLET